MPLMHAMLQIGLTQSLLLLWELPDITARFKSVNMWLENELLAQ